ncbi:MAG: hypothetical protein IPN20_15085 [Haliscomenobacter sp.]|nr:hypothetical protein [Haliscomenobacter sp.]MBP9872953.1 hypothetical protein [Haliscomenobacter sp.]
MSSISRIIFKNVALLFFLVNIIQVQGQTPEMPGWASQTPLPMSKSKCFETAQNALKSVGITNLLSLDNWSVSGTNYNVRAGISCVSCGNGVHVSIAVATTHAYPEANSLRDRLRDYMLNSVGANSQGETLPETSFNYTTTLGSLTLMINGNKITGTYESGRGTLQGTLRGSILEGTWSNSYSNKQGTFLFTFEGVLGEGSTFTGKWGYNDEPRTRNWSGSEIKK